VRVGLAHGEVFIANWPSKVPVSVRTVARERSSGKGHFPAGSIVVFEVFMVGSGAAAAVRSFARRETPRNETTREARVGRAAPRKTVSCLCSRNSCQPVHSFSKRRPVLLAFLRRQAMNAAPIEVLAVVR